MRMAFLGANGCVSATRASPTQTLRPRKVRPPRHLLRRELRTEHITELGTVLAMRMEQPHPRIVDMGWSMHSVKAMTHTGLMSRDLAAAPL